MTIYDVKMNLKNQVPMIIAIDGPSGSGKSTFSALLEAEYDVLVFHTDDYFLPVERKTPTRLEEPGGNLDYERMHKEIFEHLDDGFISSHHYNCQVEALEIRNPVMRKPVVVIEGVYSMHPLFQPYYDVMIYLSIDRETQLKRILERSNDKVLQRFISEWIPLEDQYFEEFNMSEVATLTIDATKNLRALFM